jgi:retinol dehydrogenase-14
MDRLHNRPMAAKTVLVTGGSGGIGKATARGLAKMGAHLAICGQDRVSTEGAAREIDAAAGGQTEVFVADLSSQAEVRRLADQVLQRCARIDVLVNNVGGYWDSRHLTTDGLERTAAHAMTAPRGRRPGGCHGRRPGALDRAGPAAVLGYGAGGRPTGAGRGGRPGR